MSKEYKAVVSKRGCPLESPGQVVKSPHSSDVGQRAHIKKKKRKKNLCIFFLLIVQEKSQILRKKDQT